MQSRGYGHDTRGNGGLLVGIQHYIYIIIYIYISVADNIRNDNN